MCITHHRTTKRRHEQLLFEYHPLTLAMPQGKVQDQLYNQPACEESRVKELNRNFRSSNCDVWGKGINSKSRLQSNEDFVFCQCCFGSGVSDDSVLAGFECLEVESEMGHGSLKGQR